MKLENKINKYINLIKNTENTIDKQYYLKKLNECKKDVIDLLCYNNDFLFCYYSQGYDEENGFKKYNYIKHFLNTYSIKNIYCKLDNNFCTQIANIDFDI